MVNFNSLQFETAISDGSMQQSIGHFCQSILERGLTPSQIIDAAREGDIDGNGTLDLHEFMDVCWLKLRLRLDSVHLIDMFCSCDTNGDGVLDFDEFQQGLERAQTIANESFFAMRKLPAARGDEPTRLVALVAHNNMKPSMMNFVAKHIDFFKTVSIVTTGSTGSALEKKLGLTVACKVASGPLGGDQEIGGMITNDAVAASFFFIDPLSAHPHEADIRALTRICEVHNVPCATNPSSAKALVHSFTTNEEFRLTLSKYITANTESDVVAAYMENQKKIIEAVAKHRSLGVSGQLSELSTSDPNPNPN